MTDKHSERAGPQTSADREKEVMPVEDTKDLMEDADSSVIEVTRKRFRELLLYQDELKVQNETLLITQRELDRSRARYSDLFNLAPVGYLIVDKHAMILEANTTAVCMLDGGLGSLVRQSFRWFIHPDGQDTFYTYHNRLISRASRRLEPGCSPTSCDLRMKMSSGTVFWAHLVSTSECNAAGEVLTRIALSNITENRTTEDSLRENSTTLENLINFANAPIIVWDAQFHITRFNHAFEHLTGRSEAEVLGQPLDVLFPPSLVKRSIELIQNTSTGDRWDSVEIKIIHKSGAVRTVLWNSATLYTPDGMTPIATIAQGQDITQRIEALQNLQTKNAELERFVYTVSHDLKSPLITIRTYAGMVAKNFAEGRHDHIRDDLARIEGAAEKMTDLLNDLLNLSRLGIQRSDPLIVDMNTVVADVLSQLEGLIAERQINVRVQPDIPAAVGDKTHLYEVVQNLVENAIKYMGGQPAPRIEIGAKQDGKEILYFIRDNGKGIDSRYHENIFGLFNKLDARSEGTGVGLALAKRIIERHGGRLWVESEGADKGSTFCFTTAAATAPSSPQNRRAGDKKTMNPP